MSREILFCQAKYFQSSNKLKGHSLFICQP
jgi:hypothetical protein